MIWVISIETTKAIKKGHSDLSECPLNYTYIDILGISASIRRARLHPSTTIHIPVIASSKC